MSRSWSWSCPYWLGLLVPRHQDSLRHLKSDKTHHSVMSHFYQLVDVQRFCHLIRLHSFWSHPQLCLPLIGNRQETMFVTSIKMGSTSSAVMGSLEIIIFLFKNHFVMHLLCFWNKLPASFRQLNPDHSFSHSSQPNSLGSSVSSSQGESHLRIFTLAHCVRY